MCQKKDIKSMTYEELEEFVIGLGEKKFRASQIYDWMHVKLASSFDEMTNLPVSFREKLKKNCELTVLTQADRLISSIDGTEKFLFALSDGNVVESVLMKYEHGLSVCISSQVGCRMGCRFCASTIDGLVRNLTPAEMLDEIYRIQNCHEERVSHIVIMGSGEPMDNYDNFVRFIRLISSEKGLNISQRNITVSSCGIVPRIKQLADEGLHITLAVSLHAPNDELRKQTMPIANAYSISEISEAASYYFEKTGRRITFEYALIKGQNDSRQCAEELSHIAGPLHAHVNLIPVNPIEERDYRQTEAAQIAAFKNDLEKRGINVTIRREMGRDISGACGQLRRRYINQIEAGK